MADDDKIASQQQLRANYLDRLETEAQANVRHVDSWLAAEPSIVVVYGTTEGREEGGGGGGGMGEGGGMAEEEGMGGEFQVGMGSGVLSGISIGDADGDQPPASSTSDFSAQLTPPYTITHQIPYVPSGIMPCFGDILPAGGGFDPSPPPPPPPPPPPAPAPMEEFPQSRVYFSGPTTTTTTAGPRPPPPAAAPAAAAVVAGPIQYKTAASVAPARVLPLQHKKAAAIAATARWMRTHVRESLVNIVSFSGFLLLTVIVVALLGAADEKPSGSSRAYTNAAFLLSMSLITWPYAILMLVLEIINVYGGISGHRSNKILLFIVTSTHMVLSYLFFGAACAVVGELRDKYSVFAKQRDDMGMYLGAGVLGMIAFYLFILPLPFLMVRSANNLSIKLDE